VLPDRVLTIRAGFGLLDFGVSPVTRIQVRDLVQRWHRLCGRWTVDTGRHLIYAGRRDWQQEGGAEKGNRIAGQLAELLQLPSLLVQLPKRVRALTIVPDDSLHGFPFAALCHNGRHIVEDYALTVSFEHDSTRPSVRTSGRRQALVAGVSGGVGAFPSLPGVQRELTRVETWLTRQGFEVIRLVDKAASKPDTLARLRGSCLWHMACHGVFEHHRPDQSGLVLVDSAGQVDVLSLRELAELDLSNLAHVTLSSCWSADHFVLPGRWVVGLPETLWRSGAQSVLGSLWEVSDEVAVPLMERFYSYLEDHPRDEALRRTQLDALHGNLAGVDGIDTAQPVCWAGFTLYGDYGRFGLR
jgi:CHAT domain-containing protein